MGEKNDMRSTEDQKSGVFRVRVCVCVCGKRSITNLLAREMSVYFVLRTSHIVVVKVFLVDILVLFIFACPVSSNGSSSHALVSVFIFFARSLYFTS